MELCNTVVFGELKDLFIKLKKSSEHEQIYDDKIRESGDSKDILDPIDTDLEVLMNRLDETIESTCKDYTSYTKLITMKASLLYEQAKSLLANEEYDGSRILLEKAISIIAEYHNNPQITFLYLRLINHFAFLLSKCGELENAKILLEGVVDKEMVPDVLVFSTEELFSNTQIEQKQAASKLNKLAINNLQMLGWICGRLGLQDVHAARQHLALQKELECCECDPVNWSTRCARLATLFLARNKWVLARHHIAVAGVILNRLEKDMMIYPELQRAQADLARSWIQYGLHLFNVSKKQILEGKYPGNFSEDGIFRNEDLDKFEQENQLEEDLSFPSVEVNVNVPASIIICASQARSLFLHTHTWLKRARLFYTLRDFPLQYVNAVLDLSELYRYLAFYEPDLDSRYSVQKRRSEALETLSEILREVRPQCYVAVSVELLRELAEVQIELMGINLRRLHVVEGSEENIKRRIKAVSDIHTKLGSVGYMLGHNNLDEQDESESDLQPTHDCNTEAYEEIISE